MRKLFKLSLSLVAVTVLVVSCKSNESKGGLALNANIDDVEDGTKVFVQELKDGSQTIPLDTVEVQNGKIKADLPKVDFQTLNVIRVDGLQGNVLFINENKALEADIDKDDLQSTRVEGGDANQLFADYMDRMQTSNEEFMKITDEYSQEELEDPDVQEELQNIQMELEQDNTLYRKKAIKDHPEELPSLFIFTDMMRTQIVPYDEMKELYDGLASQLKESNIGKQIEEQIAAQEGALTEGETMEDFSADTPEGDELSLYEALENGTYTLVDFWAAWCLPCRQENPNIVDMYEKYKDEGFNVLGVSLDKDKDKWIDAIEKDELEWDQISNLQFWEDPIAQDLGIKAIPANFLLNEEGEVVARNIRGQSLKAKLEDLFEN